MTRSDKKKMLKWNTFLWLAAMILPAAFQLTFGSTKFPWFVVLPLLLLGLMLTSNSMLTAAIGESTEDPPAGGNT